jgi:hypothetical protein
MFRFSGSRQLGLDEVSSPGGIVPMHGHELGAASKSVLARQTRAIGRSYQPGDSHIPAPRHSCAITRAAKGHSGQFVTP